MEQYTLIQCSYVIINLLRVIGGNLPYTLTNIIFNSVKSINETNYDKLIINFLIQKIKVIKIPYICKIYFINSKNKVYDIEL